VPSFSKHERIFSHNRRGRGPKEEPIGAHSAVLFCLVAFSDSVIPEGFWYRAACCRKGFSPRETHGKAATKTEYFAQRRKDEKFEPEFEVQVYLAFLARENPSVLVSKFFVTFGESGLNFAWVPLDIE
jgi:hypothetical protein